MLISEQTSLLAEYGIRVGVYMGHGAAGVS